MPTSARPKSLYGRLAAIASGHHLATLAAQHVVEQGGSLVDAMVAASAMLAVAMPQAGALGGCGMLLYFDAATGAVHALNGSGRAPAATPVAQFAAAGALPSHGVGAAVTPTLVRLWARAHERFGRLPWNSLLAPAIAAAGQGVGTAEELARSLAAAPAVLREQPGFGERFTRQGQLLAAGETWRQPRLSETLAAIARHGEDGFYSGWVARSLADFATEHGGWLTQDDLAHAQADWYESWHGHHAGRQVHVMPPNALGVLLLRQLNLRATALAAGAEPGPAGDVLRAAAVLQHYRAAIGDPARKRVMPGDFGLGERHLPESASCSLVAPDLAPGDAAGMVAMDVDGNAIAMLQSVAQAFGSGCVDPGTGVLLNNRMAEFDAQPGLPNSVQPMARPAHTLNPWLVLAGNRIELAGTASAGASQVTAALQLLGGALAGSDSLGELLARPAWCFGEDGTVLLETGMDPDVAALLQAQGLAVREQAPDGFGLASIQAVRMRPQGGLEAAVDARRQAHAVTW